MNLRKTVRNCALAALCLTSWPAAWAQSDNAAPSYPNRPIKFIVPFAPGGLGDVFARELGQKLGQTLGQPVVIYNRPGGSQIIAAETAAKSAPDGYTLFLGTQTSMVLNSISKKALPYNPIKDFDPIGTLFAAPYFLVVNPSLPVNSVKDLIALAKSQPGKLTFASLGQGTSPHLAAEMFKTQTGIDILHIPYTGSSAAIADVVSGQVSMMFEGGATALSFAKSGKLKVLASTGKNRSEDSIKDLPTVGETVPGYHIEAWFSMVTAAGTPRPIIDRLNREVVRILGLPELHELAVTTGALIMPSTPEELAARIRSESTELGVVMRNAGIVPQD